VQIGRPKGEHTIRENRKMTKAADRKNVTSICEHNERNRPKERKKRSKKVREKKVRDPIGTTPR